MPILSDVTFCNVWLNRCWLNQDSVKIFTRCHRHQLNRRTFSLRRRSSNYRPPKHLQQPHFTSTPTLQQLFIQLSPNRNSPISSVLALTSPMPSRHHRASHAPPSALLVTDIRTRWNSSSGRLRRRKHLSVWNVCRLTFKELPSKCRARFKANTFLLSTTSHETR